MIPAWLILLIAAVWYLAFYFTYGKYLERRVVEASKDRLTPAHTKFDGIDYVPADRAILYGHHVGAIAGTGPIVGPTMAMAWGWLPALLWILIANAIIGAVHDYLSLMASVRYEGRSIAIVSERVISPRMRYVFVWYIFFALILIIAAFTIFDAQLFLVRPQVATAILLFMPIAILVGVLIYKYLLPLRWALLIGLSFIIVAIFTGYHLPLVITDYNTWVTLLLVYAWLAGWLPLWYLLQPRDFMNIYILWAGVIIGAISLIVSLATIKISPVTSFTHILVGYKPSPIWPVIVLVIACGALSGFHSLVASGTSARQLNNELDALLIGYGGMFSEGIVALVVSLTVATTLPQSFAMLSSVTSWPAGVPKDMYTFVIANTLGAFTQGYGIMVHNAFGIDILYGAIFAGLWFATFDFAVLDTASRLARWTWDDILEPLAKRLPSLHKALTNRFVGATIPLLISGSLAYTGTIAYVWPAFSGANQLLAALALLTVSSWVIFILRKPRSASLAILIPALFLWLTVTTALFWYVINVSYPLLMTGLAKHVITTIYLGAALTTITVILIFLDLYMMGEFINYAVKKRRETIAAKGG